MRCKYFSLITSGYHTKRRGNFSVSQYGPQARVNVPHLAKSNRFIVQTFTDIGMFLMMQLAAFKFQKLYDQLNFWFREQN
jgi:hypothetical protein